MENKTQGTGSAHTDSSAASGVSYASTSGQPAASGEVTPVQKDQSSSVEPVGNAGPAPEYTPDPPQKHHLKKVLRTTGIVALVLLLIGGAVFGIEYFRSGNDAGQQSASKLFDNTQVPLESLVGQDGVNVLGSRSLIINGQLHANEGLTLTPGEAPEAPTEGQIYYDQNTNELGYYNGGQFIFLSEPQEQTGGVESLGGGTGDITTGTGLLLVGGALSNSGVVSFQGQTGAVTLSAGTGIGINGTTISNNGDLILGNEITNVVSGGGLVRVGSGTTISPYQVALQACPSGQILESTGGGSWTCGIDDGSSASYTAGNGLQLIGNEFSVNSATCAGTDKLQWNGSAFACTADVDTDTTYSAGSGLSLVGTTFNNTGDLTVGNEVVNITSGTSGLQRAGSGTSGDPYTLGIMDCANTEVLQSGGAGVWVCASASGVGTSYGVIAGGGLRLVGSDFGLTDTCSNGELLQAQATAGQWDCVASGSVGTTATLQSAYDAGNTITTSDGRNINFTLADTTTDSDFVVNMVGTGNQIRFEDGGSAFATFSDGGLALFKPVGSDSASAFRVQNAGGTTTVFNIDTTATNAITLGADTDFLLQGAGAYISNSQDGTDSEAFGWLADTSGSRSVAFGYQAGGGANQITAIGYQASSSSNGTAVGFQATSGSAGAALGTGASAASGGSIAIGQAANSSTSSIAIGAGSVTGGNNAIAFGPGADAGVSSSIAIGWGADAGDFNQLVIGGSSSEGYITQAYLGSGVTDVTPQDVTINATGGSGTDVAGATMTIAGGRGTGSANGGDISFQIADPGTSGSGLNALATVGAFSGADGAFTLQNAVDSTTAFQVLNQAGTTTLLNADTINNRIGIGTDTPAATVDIVHSDINETGLYLHALAGQVADLMVAYDGDGQRTTYLNEKGELRVIAADDNTVAVRIKQRSGSQTGNLTDWTDISNNVLSYFDADARLSIGSGSALPSSVGLRVAGDDGLIPTIANRTNFLIHNTSDANDNASMSIVSGNSGFSSIFFGDTDAEDIGQIEYWHDFDLFRFTANGQLAFNIQDTGITVFGGGATLGDAAQQGNLVINDGNGQAATLTTADQTSNVTITIPDAGSNDTICLQNLGNCSGGSASAFVQDGNAFSETAVLGTTDTFGLDIITDGNTVASLSDTGEATFQNSTDSANAFRILSADDTSLVNLDSLDRRLTIGNAEPSPDDIPSVTGFQEDNDNSTGLVNMALPAGVQEGELLLVFAHLKDDNEMTFDTGWTRLDFQYSGDLLGGGIAAGYKYSDGTETTVGVDVGSPGSDLRTYAYRIQNHDPLAPPEIAVTNGSSTSPDPPALSPTWGAANTLTWAYMGTTGFVDLNSSPCADNSTSTDAADILTAICSDELTTATVDPAAFSTTGASPAWAAATVSVKGTAFVYDNVVIDNYGGLNVLNGDLAVSQGNASFQNFANNTAAFSVLNVSGDTLFNIDTVNDEITFGGHVLPDADDTHDLGSSINRWRDLYLGPSSLHIGTDGDEGVISYNTTTDEFEFDRAIATTTNTSNTDSPGLKVVQQGSGDTSMEFSLDGINGFYAGQDASNSGAFTINSSTAATSVTDTVVRTGSVGSINSDLNADSQSITVPADADIIVVGASVWHDDNYLANGAVSLAGTPLSLATEYPSSHQSALWHMTTPPTGTQTLSWDWDGSDPPDEGTTLFYAFYEGVDTSSPIQDADNSAGSISSSSTEIGPLVAQTNSAAVAVNAAHDFGGDTLSWTNATELAEVNYRSNVAGFAEAFPSSDITITSSTTGQDISVSGVILRPAQSVGPLNDTFANAVFTMAQGGALTLQNITDSASAFQVMNSNGDSVFNVDTTNGRVGVGTATPTATFDVEGKSKFTDVSDGNDYMLEFWTNGGGFQFGGLAENFFGLGDLDGTGVFTSIEPGTIGLRGQGGNLTLEITQYGNSFAEIVYENDIRFQGNDDTDSFQILDNDGGVPVFNVDTANERIGIGTDAPTAALHVVGDTFIEDKLGLGKQSFTTASGSVGSEVLTPTSSYVAVTVSEDGDELEIDTTGASDGDMLIIVNVDSTATDTVNIDEDADPGIRTFLEADPVPLDRADSITLIYSSDLAGWVQTGESDNTP